MGRHGITLVARGNPINPWGIKWKTWCVTASRGTPDKISQYVHHINDTLGRLDRATNLMFENDTVNHGHSRHAML
jgi:hypothetical protein